MTDYRLPKLEYTTLVSSLYERGIPAKTISEILNVSLSFVYLRLNEIKLPLRGNCQRCKAQTLTADSTITI